MQNHFFTKKIYFLLLTGGLVCLTSCTKVQKNFYPNGVLESEITYSRGEMNGPAVWYYEHGQKRMEALYEKGRLQGKCTRYYRNGKKESVACYRADTLEGEWLCYDEDGLLSERISYENGRKQGPYTAYHDGKQPMVEGFYADDQFDGDWTYYDENGFVVGKAVFSHGKGELEAFDNQNRLVRKVSYLNSQKHGLEQFLNEKGEVTLMLLYEAGRLKDTVRVTPGSSGGLESSVGETE